jgi:hypothetical protein
MAAKKRTLGGKPRKIVRWHEGFVVFVTKEAKDLKWDDKTLVKVYMEKEGIKDRIVIEKAGRIELEE